MAFFNDLNPGYRGRAEKGTVVKRDQVWFCFHGVGGVYDLAGWGFEGDLFAGNILARAGWVIK